MSNNRTRKISKTQQGGMFRRIFTKNKKKKALSAPDDKRSRGTKLRTLFRVETKNDKKSNLEHIENNLKDIEASLEQIENGDLEPLLIRDGLDINLKKTLKEHFKKKIKDGNVIGALRKMQETPPKDLDAESYIEEINNIIKLYEKLDIQLGKTKGKQRIRTKGKYGQRDLYTINHNEILKKIKTIISKLNLNDQKCKKDIEEKIDEYIKQSRFNCEINEKTLQVRCGPEVRNTILASTRLLNAVGWLGKRLNSAGEGIKFIFKIILGTGGASLLLVFALAVLSLALVVDKDILESATNEKFLLPRVGVVYGSITASLGKIIISLVLLILALLADTTRFVGGSTLAILATPVLKASQVLKSKNGEDEADVGLYVNATGLWNIFKTLTGVKNKELGNLTKKAINIFRGLSLNEKVLFVLKQVKGLLNLLKKDDNKFKNNKKLKAMYNFFYSLITPDTTKKLKNIIKDLEKEKSKTRDDEIKESIDTTIVLLSNMVNDRKSKQSEMIKPVEDKINKLINSLDHDDGDKRGATGGGKRRKTRKRRRKRVKQTRRSR
jgi:hypothetical protein